MSDKENPWVPSHSGKVRGYQAEYRTMEKGSLNWLSWKPVPIEKSEIGIPYPGLHGNHLESLGLMGFEQAKAHAWWTLACSKSGRRFSACEVRVQEYEVEYDLKARKIGDPKTEEDEDAKWEKKNLGDLSKEEA